MKTLMIPFLLCSIMAGAVLSADSDSKKDPVIKVDDTEERRPLVLIFKDYVLIEEKHFNNLVSRLGKNQYKIRLVLYPFEKYIYLTHDQYEHLINAPEVLIGTTRM